jgi:uncharacterized protein YdhG (YjbR/CyaY superfamily)
MKKGERESATMAEYIHACPRPVREKLVEIRELVRKLAPGAEERISYRMPAFFLNGPLVYFAAYEKHIGFYPTASGIRAFQKEVSGYKNSKGAVQFPLEEPLPTALIRKIVRFRVAENRRKLK